MANCGSMRREEIRSSRVSARARPILFKHVSTIAQMPFRGRLPYEELR